MPFAAEWFKSLNKIVTASIKGLIIAILHNLQPIILRMITVEYHISLWLIYQLENIESIFNLLLGVDHYSNFIRVVTLKIDFRFIGWFIGYISITPNEFISW